MKELRMNVFGEVEWVETAKKGKPKEEKIIEDSLVEEVAETSAKEEQLITEPLVNEIVEEKPAPKKKGGRKKKSTKPEE